MLTATNKIKTWAIICICELSALVDMHSFFQDGIIYKEKKSLRAIHMHFEIFKCDKQYIIIRYDGA